VFVVIIVIVGGVCMHIYYLYCNILYMYNAGVYSAASYLAIYNNMLIVVHAWFVFLFVLIEIFVLQID